MLTIFLLEYYTASIKVYFEGLNLPQNLKISKCIYKFNNHFTTYPWDFNLNVFSRYFSMFVYFLGITKPPMAVNSFYHRRFFFSMFVFNGLVHNIAVFLFEFDFKNDQIFFQVFLLNKIKTGRISSLPINIVNVKRIFEK